MTNIASYTEACSDFEKVYDAAIATRQPIVVTREGSESVAVIPIAELNSLTETVYLFQSHENAVRLLDALQRAQAGTNEPQTLENVRREFGLEDNEEKISA